MANVVYELMAVLGLDSKPFEDGLNGAKETAKGGGSKISSVLGGAAKAAGVALAAASTAVVAFGQSSIDAGKEFDSSMSQVYATMGNVDDMGADSFNKLKAAAQEMGVAFDETTTATELSREVLRAFAQEEGATTAFSATQAADALNYMALAGYDATTSMDMLPNVLNLAAAGGMELSSASDMVTDAQSALGLSLEETSDMVDQMAKASSKSNTSVTQLGDAILTIGATARNVKGGTAELSTVLGVLADNGIKGSEGGTHLRNVIMSLQNPTKDGAAALEELGVSVYDSDGNMRSLVDIISDLQTGLGNMDQASRDAMINGIFNKTDAAAVNALIGTSRERFDELTAAIVDSHGAALAMADTQLDNLAGDITLFQSALEGAKIAVSDSLTPTLREFVQFGTQAVSELGTAFREDGLEGAINALGPIIDRGVEMLFEVLPKVLEAGVALLDALITAIITNLPKLIPAAIQIIKQLVDSIVKNIDKIMDAAIEIIFALADGLIDALPKLIPAIIKIILAITEKLTEPDTLLKLVDASLQIIGAIGQGLIAAIPDLLKSLVVVLANLIEYIIKWAPHMVEGGIAIIHSWAEGISQAASEVWDGIKSVAQGIWDTITGLVDKAKEWGRDLIKNFMDGIKEKGGAFIKLLIKLAEGAKELIGHSHPKKGPLADDYKWMPDMMELFAKGIRDNEHLVTGQIEKSFDFGGNLMSGAAPALAAGPTTNTWNITVNNIDELDQLVRWWEGRQVEERMK